MCNWVLLAALCTPWSINQLGTFCNFFLNLFCPQYKGPYLKIKVGALTRCFGLSWGRNQHIIIDERVTGGSLAVNCSFQRRIINRRRRGATTDRSDFFVNDLWRQVEAAFCPSLHCRFNRRHFSRHHINIVIVRVKNFSDLMKESCSKLDAYGFECPL